MNLDSLREWIDSFLAAAEAERFEIGLAHRRWPQLGELYERNADLFSIARITEVQRALAAVSGTEERRLRSVLEFLARGRALLVARDPLDQRLGWEMMEEVPLEGSRIPQRQIGPALALAADPDRRRAISEAHLSLLEEQRYLPEEFLHRQRDGIAELGYGSHVESYQILAGLDLRVVAREGARFLEQSADLYFELLGWHLPRLTGVAPGEARASDAERLNAAVDYDSIFSGADRYRGILESLDSAGLDPSAEGRIRIERDVNLSGGAGGIAGPIRVPEEVRLAIAARAGKPAASSFLRALGIALHSGYTDPDLPVEQRRLADESVTLASGGLCESLLRNPAFLRQLYDFPKERLGDFLALTVLGALFTLRRDIALLHFEIEFYDEQADGARFAELLTEATGFRHDPRAAVWQVSSEFAPAGKLRAAQLAAIHAQTLRQRFDEDWFRNPEAGAYLRDLFSQGRRYSAPELAIQLSSAPLGYDVILNEFMALL